MIQVNRIYLIFDPVHFLVDSNEILQIVIYVQFKVLIMSVSLDSRCKGIYDLCSVSARQK